MTFGQSAHPGSPHYFDQAPLYAAGKMKDAWYYKEDVMKHAVKTYRPGEE
jgi:penicillin amidase